MVFPFNRAPVEAIFPYRSKETKQLEADLLEIYVDPAPFWSLENDILLAMFHRKTDYFKLLKNSSTFKKIPISDSMSQSRMARTNLEKAQLLLFTLTKDMISMNIIERYESGSCDLEELSERLPGLTDECLEAAVGYEKLVFYTELIFGYHNELFFKGGKHDGNIERNCYEDKSAANVEPAANPFLDWQSVSYHS